MATVKEGEEGGRVRVGKGQREGVGERRERGGMGRGKDGKRKTAITLVMCCVCRSIFGC